MTGLTEIAAHGAADPFHVAHQPRPVEAAPFAYTCQVLRGCLLAHDGRGHVAGQYLRDDEDHHRNEPECEGHEQHTAQKKTSHRVSQSKLNGAGVSGAAQIPSLSVAPGAAAQQETVAKPSSRLPRHSRFRGGIIVPLPCGGTTGRRG